MRRAACVDLPAFLERRGERLQKAGSSYKLIYTDGSGTHDSIMINGSKWFDHKNQYGGGPVKLLREHFGLTYQEAMLELLGGSVSRTESRAILSKPKEKPKKEFKLPGANSDMRRVFAYLTKQRFIAPEIISFFAHEHKIYEDKDHHNAVFVGMDGNGVPRQAHKRSANSFGKTFRLTCEGSDTSYSFSHFGKSEKLFVFEAPIDMMSFLTLYPQNWQEHSCIAMNGVYENAVLTALKEHPGLDRIVLCTDNDEGGIEAADRLRDILAENGYRNVSRISPVNKDFNEDLKALHDIAPQPAIPHKRKETYTEEAGKIKPITLNVSRSEAYLKSALDRKDYFSAAQTALTASAIFLARANGDTYANSFEKLRSYLAASYKPYTDKGLTQSRLNALEKAADAAVKSIREPICTGEHTLQTSKLLFQTADRALRCHTERLITENPVQNKEPAASDKETQAFITL